MKLTSRPLRILLAEDHIINQRLAVALLSKHGHTVEIAANGREAVDQLAQRTFDIVLMDIQMPLLNGLEATAEIRRQEKSSGHHVPIIAMTAHAMTGDRERCLAAGMDGYVPKPIDAAQLFAAIETLVPKHLREEVETAVCVETVEGDLVLDALIARADGDVELARELAVIFLDDWPKLSSAIRKAIDSADAPKLDRAAHTARGSLGYFSKGGAVEAASRLEKMGAECDLSNASQTFAELEESVSELLPKLVEFGSVSVS